ncbi:MAG: thioesterase family protein [Actinomycetota bacterium]|nr:thioesterase family protein [Actinomycetota bacterium]
MTTADLFVVDATDAPTRFTWDPSPYLLTPAGTLQGGAGLGGAVSALEAVTGRPLLWATAQYLSYAAGTDRYTLDVTVEAAGHNTSQARCVITRDDREVLTAHAALGGRDIDHDGVWAIRPDVAEPHDCPTYDFFRPSDTDFAGLIDIRLARGRQEYELDGTRGDGSWAAWFRLAKGAHPTSIGELTFVSDFAPMAFAEALGLPYSGNSLDNTIRMGASAATEWILLSVHVNHLIDGFGHVNADLWAQDGTLLAQGSQSAVVRRHRTIARRGVPDGAV